jgi:hypothetical protein
MGDEIKISGNYRNKFKIKYKYPPWNSSNQVSAHITATTEAQCLNTWRCNTIYKQDSSPDRLAQYYCS